MARSWSRPASVLAAVAIGLGAASEALADPPERTVCVEAYVDAQGARKNGQLLRAKRGLEVCANAACPGMVQRDCSTWLEEVTRALPTVVLVARDAAGRDLLGASATLDGAIVPLDGRPLPLDPGPHKVRVQPAGGEAMEQSFVVAEGEHDRAIVVAMPRPDTPTPERPVPGAPSHAQPGHGIPVASWVLGGAGVAALGAFTYFAVRGANDRSSLGCDRGCTSSAYDQVDREFWAGDVALGIGLACAGAAVAVWLMQGDAPKGEANAAMGPSPLRFAF